MQVESRWSAVRLGAALCAVMAAALGWCATASAQSGIVGSKHDLATGTNDNYEVCVYCHTPHGGNADVEAPLWNKPGGVQAYRTYDSATIDGKILPVGSVSTACLSCHDGTQAMDTVINAPGSGLGDGRIRSGVGALSPNVIANLGVDLRNDHPVGVQYGGFADGRGQIDPDFVNSATGLQSALMLGRTRWWVDTERVPNANRDKTDMILYTRSVNGVDQPFVLAPWPSTTRGAGWCPADPTDGCGSGTRRPGRRAPAGARPSVVTATPEWPVSRSVERTRVWQAERRTTWLACTKSRRRNRGTSSARMATSSTRWPWHHGAASWRPEPTMDRSP